MWIDADAMIVNSDVSLSSIVNKAEYMDLIIGEDMNEASYINAGIFLLKVNPWSYELLVDCYKKTEKYFTVAHFDQAALEKQLKMRFQGFDKYKQPFHSFADGGIDETKFFSNVCVLTSRDFNTNIEDAEIGRNEEGEEGYAIGGVYAEKTNCNDNDDSNISEISSNKQHRKERGGWKKLSKLNELRRRAKEVDGETYNGYAKFAFHVAGRRNKAHLLLQMLQSRQIKIPEDISEDHIFKFNARPSPSAMN